jgi:hypothetical protein
MRDERINETFDRVAAEPMREPWQIVGVRLVEAADVVRRMPMRIWPKQFGTAWPHFAAMTPGELQAFKNDLIATQGEAALLAWEREQNRTRSVPSGREIERMDQAIGWFVRYLSHDAWTAKVVGHWANTTFHILNEDDIKVVARPGLKMIARGLRIDRVSVAP